MEPISALLGLGTQLVGSVLSYQAATRQNELQRQDIGLQQKVEEQRRQAMELDANRKSMEVFRNNQRARSMGLQAATSQGAQFGSGLQGAYGQTRGQSGVNELGIAQNLTIGENIFDINSQRSSVKLNMAENQQDAQFGAALTGLGGSLFGASKSLNNLGFSGPSNSTPQPNYGMGLFGGNQTGSLY